MDTFVDTCIAEAEAAGWPNSAVIGLLLNERSSTREGFNALLKEANEIRAFVKIVGNNMRSLGFDPEGAAEFFVARGYSYAKVREDTSRVMAEYDDATVVNTTPPAAKAVLADPYAARAAQIDAYKAKTP